MNIRCPHCKTLFRIDPARIPAPGIRARCARCGDSFPVHREGGPSAAVPPEPAADSNRSAPPNAAGADPNRQPIGGAARGPEPPEAAAAPATPREARPAELMGVKARPEDGPPAHPDKSRASRAARPADAPERAQRIARALVSDIVVYHPERRQKSLAAGNLKREFRDELLKSWQEYVEQVGLETARDTPYFRDALNEILASGQKVF